MKLRDYIFIGVIGAIIGAMTFFGVNKLQQKASAPVQGIDTVWVKHYGFKPIKDTPAWSYTLDKCVPCVLILAPAVIEKSRENIWLLSASNDMKVGVNIDCLRTQEELEKWMEFIAKK